MRQEGIRLIEKEEPAAGKWAGEKTCALLSLGDSGAGRLSQHPGAACSCTGPQFDVRHAHGVHSSLQLHRQGNSNTLLPYPRIRDTVAA